MSNNPENKPARKRGRPKGSKDSRKRRPYGSRSHKGVNRTSLRIRSWHTPAAKLLDKVVVEFDGGVRLKFGDVMRKELNSQLKMKRKSLLHSIVASKALSQEKEN